MNIFETLIDNFLLRKYKNMLELILPISVEIKPTKFPFKVYVEITAGKAGKGEMQKINIVME